MSQATRMFPGGAPDQETHDLMHDLSRMQTWAVALACSRTPGAREAMDLLQRTRCFIVERVFPSANRGLTPSGASDLSANDCQRRASHLRKPQ
jgi:hypothetical protein